MKESNQLTPRTNLKTAPPADLDDVALMRLIPEGNTEALAVLYDRHASLIYSVLMQKLEDPAEAQDIVHDVFVKLHTKSHLYSPSLGKPVAWLLTVARNAATDKLRKRSTHQKYVNKAMLETEQSAPAHPGPHGDELELLRHCLAILPNQQQNILQLAYFSGLTQQEIANRLTQPLGSVKAWIRRGLIKLRDCVGGNL
jgi:RNA polymerase sigma-70 factor (ECF subfamily)